MAYPTRATIKTVATARFSHSLTPRYPMSLLHTQVTALAAGILANPNSGIHNPIEIAEIALATAQAINERLPPLTPELDETNPMVASSLAARHSYHGSDEPQNGPLTDNELPAPSFDNSEEPD